jgi:hypothetical protein
MTDRHTASSLTLELRQCLCGQEWLVRTAVETGEALQAAIRGGDPDQIAAAQTTLGKAAATLQQSTDRLLAASAAVSQALGLTGSSRPRLSAIAARLPAPEAGELLAAGRRLARATADLRALQRRNATLINQLRSYFRGVMSALTVADDPVRYGPSGTRLSPAVTTGIHTRG